MFALLKKTSQKFNSSKRKSETKTDDDYFNGYNNSNATNREKKQYCSRFDHMIQFGFNTRRSAQSVKNGKWHWQSYKINSFAGNVIKEEFTRWWIMKSYIPMCVSHTQISRSFNYIASSTLGLIDNIIRIPHSSSWKSIKFAEYALIHYNNLSENHSTLNEMDPIIILIIIDEQKKIFIGLFRFLWCLHCVKIIFAC